MALSGIAATGAFGPVLGLGVVGVAGFVPVTVVSPAVVVVVVVLVASSVAVTVAYCIDLLDIMLNCVFCSICGKEFRSRMNLRRRTCS